MDNLSNIHANRAGFVYFDSKLFKPNGYFDIFYDPTINVESNLALQKVNLNSYINIYLKREFY